MSMESNTHDKCHESAQMSYDFSFSLFLSDIVQRISTVRFYEFYEIKLTRKP